MITHSIENTGVLRTVWQLAKPGLLNLKVELREADREHIETGLRNCPALEPTELTVSPLIHLQSEWHLQGVKHRHK